MKLPKVEKETYLRIKKEMENSGFDGVFAARMIDRLEKENPNIAYVIAMMANRSDDPKAVAACATLVYRLLEAEKAIQEERPSAGLIN